MHRTTLLLVIFVSMAALASAGPFSVFKKKMGDHASGGGIISNKKNKVQTIFQKCKGGNDGSKGEAGPQGPEGPQGLDGNPGEQGEPGLRGVTGSLGLRGLTGTRGERGDQGGPGVPGRQDDDIVKRIIKVEQALYGFGAGGNYWG